MRISQPHVTKGKMAAAARGVLSVLAMLALSVTAAQGTLLYQNVTYSGSLNNASNTTVGLQFQVGNDPIKVTALGIWDQGQAALSASHQVGLWELGNGTPIAQATVGSGTSNTLVTDGTDGFRFALSLLDGSGNPITSLNPLILPAGGQYRVGEVQETPDTYINMASGGTSYDFTSAATAGDGWWSSGFTYPAHINNGAPYFGPNIEFDILVPEPSTMMLFGLGAGLLWLRRRNR